MTLIIGPFEDEEETERKDILRGQQFNAARDAIMKVNILAVAEKLNDEVDMLEAEFRDLLKKVFPDVPSSHIHSIVRTVRMKGKKKRFDTLVERVGGIM